MENNEKKPFPPLEETGTDITPDAKETLAESADTTDDYAAYVEYTNAHEVEKDDGVLTSNGNYDDDMWMTEAPVEDKKKSTAGRKLLLQIFDFAEMLAVVTVCIILCFSLFFRLNIVDGPSMESTLHTGEYLVVSDVLYTPKTGDIVVIHDLTAGNYTDPIVKRVIATEGQTVDIDFETWTVTVDGEVLDESSYRRLDGSPPRYPTLEFPLTVEEGHVFVMGDNRYLSADSRLPEIGTVDERCVVGKVYARVFPFESFTLFDNPFKK